MRFIVSILFALCAITTYAQDTYTKTLAELMTLTGTQNIDPQQAAQGFAQIALQQYPDLNEASAQQITERYFKTQFATDMASIMEPIYRKHVTEEDMQSYIADATSTAGKRSFEHAGQMAKNQQNIIQPCLINAITAIAQGQTPAPITINPTLPDSYKTKYKQYYDITGVDKIITTLKESIIGSMSQQAGNTEEGRKLVDGIMTYIQNNLYPLILNTSADYLTEADLEFQIALYSSAAGQHVAIAGMEFASNPLEIGNQLIQKYLDWVQKNK